MSRGRGETPVGPLRFAGLGNAAGRGLAALLGGDTVLLLALAAVVGVGGGYGALLFRMLIGAVGT